MIPAANVRPCWDSCIQWWISCLIVGSDFVFNRWLIFTSWNKHLILQSYTHHSYTAWALWHVKSLASQLFVQHLVQASRKENMITDGFPSQRASDAEIISHVKTSSCVTFQCKKVGSKFACCHCVLESPRLHSLQFSSLTHWGRDKMAAISQMKLSNGFSLMNMYEFLIRFHWRLFLGVQLTIFQHWFR